MPSCASSNERGVSCKCQLVCERPERQGGKFRTVPVRNQGLHVRNQDLHACTFKQLM